MEAYFTAHPDVTLVLMAPEGNTLTLQETHLVINEGITIGGKSMQEHLEAVNHQQAIQFIKDVAVDWDDTKILHAEPGDFITIARKAKGTNNWFVGSITDENARELVMDCSFLDAGKKYAATIYKDAENASWDNNPEAYKIEKITLTNKSKVKLKLARGGGTAISIFEIK